METERCRQAKRTIFLLSRVQRTGNTLLPFTRREIEMLSAVILVGNRMESARSVFVSYVVCAARHRAMMANKCYMMMSARRRRLCDTHFAI